MAVDAKLFADTDTNSMLAMTIELCLNNQANINTILELVTHASELSTEEIGKIHDEQLVKCFQKLQDRMA